MTKTDKLLFCISVLFISATCSGCSNEELAPPRTFEEVIANPSKLEGILGEYTDGVVVDFASNGILVTYRAFPVRKVGRGVILVYADVFHKTALWTIVSVKGRIVSRILNETREPVYRIDGRIIPIGALTETEKLKFRDLRKTQAFKDMINSEIRH